MKISKLMSVSLASMILLTGCSSEIKPKIVDDKYVLSSIDGTNYFADDVYNDLLNAPNAAGNLYQIFLKQLFKKEQPVTPEMEKEADVMIKEVKSNFSGKDKDLKEQLKQSGYTDLESYKNAYIEYLQYSAFVDQYITDHFEELFERYYNSTNPRYVSHILVKMEDPDHPTEEEQAKLDQVQAELASGKDFAEVAKELSDDGSAKDGGNLGLCDKNTNFVPEFKDEMMKLKEGEVSGPVKSQYGYHIIKVTSTSKDQMKEDLNKPNSALRNWASDTYFDKYLEFEIYNSYDITYYDEHIKELVENYVTKALEEGQKAEAAAQNQE